MFGRSLFYIIVTLGIGGFLVAFGPMILLGLGMGGRGDLASRTPMNDSAAIAEDVIVQAPIWALRPNCQMPQRPVNARIHAVTLYEGGIETPVQEFGTEAHQVDLVVTDTSGPIYLLLASRNAVIWNLRAAPKVVIGGIVTSGFDRQIVVTKQSRASLLPASAGEKACGAILQRARGLELLNAVSAEELAQISTQAFGRVPDNVVEKYTAESVILGPETTTLAPEADAIAVPDVFVDHHRPILFGRPALTRLVAEGALAPATEADVTKWRTAGPLSQNTPSYITELDLARTYLVKRPFRLPLGLIGEASAAFILPAGMKMPEGWIGENVFLKYAPFGCGHIEGWQTNCDRKSIGSFQSVGIPLQSGNP